MDQLVSPSALPGARQWLVCKHCRQPKLRTDFRLFPVEHPSAGRPQGFQVCVGCRENSAKAELKCVTCQGLYPKREFWKGAFTFAECKGCRKPVRKPVNQGARSFGCSGCRLMMPAGAYQPGIRPRTCKSCYASAEALRNERYSEIVRLWGDGMSLVTIGRRFRLKNTDTERVIVKHLAELMKDPALVEYGALFTRRWEALHKNLGQVLQSEWAALATKAGTKG